MNSNFDSFRIAMLIKEIYSKSMYVVDENLKNSGLTHQQIMVIKLIAHNKEMTISDLCCEMSLVKGTVSGIVTRLEQYGYLEKIKYADDRRNTYVRFSKEGMEFAKSFKETIQESFDNIFKDCSEEELREFVKVLRNISSKINR
ncbi:MarR family transcriptional regulator [uncultured Clostridium sp.]|uniref:MarR family winged helix-turn-helix transcriptional regulator n=1 Tax=uncultured Clostridium sp. TaxID=59620 RepID=UPI0028E1CBB3|nr:MarR family transcriptional regulator [uncultured Clostridium sp.]